MNEKQKDFLNDLAALFRKYNIDCVRSISNQIIFESNGYVLKIEGYDRHTNEVFKYVVYTCIASNYVPQSFFDSANDIIDGTTKEVE